MNGPLRPRDFNAASTSASGPPPSTQPANNPAQRPPGATYGAGAAASDAGAPRADTGIESKRILLRTATVWAKTRHGFMKLRCLLDTGCQRTIVRAPVAKKLGLKAIGRERCQILGVNGVADGLKVRRRYELQLQARDVDGQPAGAMVAIYALAVDDIGVPVPHAPAGPWLEELFQASRMLADEVD